MYYLRCEWYSTIISETITSFVLTSIIEGINKRLPSGHYKEVQPVPGVREVRPLPVNPHRDHFDRHLQGEEGEDNVVEHLRTGATRGLIRPKDA